MRSAFETLKPIYETMPGWSESTFGAKSLDQLPQNAINYVKRLEQLIECPIDIISTGPDRDETIVFTSSISTHNVVELRCKSLAKAGLFYITKNITSKTGGKLIKFKCGKIKILKKISIKILSQSIFCIYLTLFINNVEIMMNYKKSLACFAVAASLSGCTTIADLAGADSAIFELTGNTVL